MLTIAVASGMLGIFTIMRKMTLASDSLSHVALPGIGIALLLHFDPFIGGLVTLLLGVILVWYLEDRTQISTETVIGVVFAASLAIGSLLTPGEELLDTLFGTTGVFHFSSWMLGVSAAIAIIIFLWRAQDRLVLAFVSNDLATVSGVRVRTLNLAFLFVFAVNMMLGLQFLGVLLMGSMIIVPAAVGRVVGGSLRHALFISVCVSLLSVTFGYGLAAITGAALGPVIIAVASGFFVLSFLLKRSG